MVKSDWPNERSINDRGNLSKRLPGFMPWGLFQELHLAKTVEHEMYERR